MIKWIQLIIFLISSFLSYCFDHISLVSDNKVYASIGQDVIIRCDTSSYQRYLPLDRESIIYSLSDEINASMSKTKRQFLGWTKQSLKQSESLFNNDWPIIESTLFGLNKSCLVIQDVNPSDEGVYTCFYSVHWFPELPLSLFETFWSLFISDTHNGLSFLEQIKHLTCAGTWPFDHICIMGHSLRIFVNDLTPRARIRIKRRDLPHCFFLTRKLKSSNESSYWIWLFFLVFLFILIFTILYLIQLYSNNNIRIPNYSLYQFRKKSQDYPYPEDKIESKELLKRKYRIMKTDFEDSSDDIFNKSTKKSKTFKSEQEEEERKKRKLIKNDDDDDDDILSEIIFDKDDKILYTTKRKGDAKFSGELEDLKALKPESKTYSLTSDTHKSLRPKDIRTLADRKPSLHDSLSGVSIERKQSFSKGLSKLRRKSRVDYLNDYNKRNRSLETDLKMDLKLNDGKLKSREAIISTDRNETSITFNKELSVKVPKEPYKTKEQEKGTKTREENIKKIELERERIQEHLMEEEKKAKEDKSKSLFKDKMQNTSDSLTKDFTLINDGKKKIESLKSQNIIPDKQTSISKIIQWNQMHEKEIEKSITEPKPQMKKENEESAMIKKITKRRRRRRSRSTGSRGSKGSSESSESSKSSKSPDKTKFPHSNEFRTFYIDEEPNNEIIKRDEKDESFIEDQNFTTGKYKNEDIIKGKIFNDHSKIILDNKLIKTSKTNNEKLIKKLNNEKSMNQITIRAKIKSEKTTCDASAVFNLPEDLKEFTVLLEKDGN